MPIRLRRNRAGLALLAVAAALALGACSSKPKPTFAIVHATVIDASGSEPNPDTTVLLAASAFLRLAPRSPSRFRPARPGQPQRASVSFAERPWRSFCTRVRPGICANARSSDGNSGFPRRIEEGKWDDSRANGVPHGFNRHLHAERVAGSGVRTVHASERDHFL